MPRASSSIAIAEWGFGRLPVCIAKTQYSLTDDPKRMGAPTGWTLHVNDVSLSAGAGFVVAVAGNMMLMPGLPREPRALCHRRRGEEIVGSTQAVSSASDRPAGSMHLNDSAVGSVSRELVAHLQHCILACGSRLLPPQSQISAS